MAGFVLFANPVFASEISADALERLSPADVVILGEIHDNPEHHRNQAMAVAAIQPRALVFEMLTPQKAMQTPTDRSDAAALARVFDWQSSGWPDFAMYHPIFAAAPEARIYGGDLPPGDARRAVSEGAASVFGADAPEYGLGTPLSPEDQSLREAEQRDAHCNALPEDLLSGMVEAQRLRDAGVDIPKLARDGVTIFFTQVFRDGFFHADMHPGNIQVSVAPDTFGRYIALDFGIVGTLTEFDKEYLAQNFIAFFRRDYKRVAELHLESGWVPQGTRVDELEGAIRAVCEPHFDRPLKDISLGQVLLRLFQTSRRFNVEIQPQLVLLQKTLLNVEGLGRQLDPDLDLWATAKPFLERWMNDQIGWRGFLGRLKNEAPRYVQLLPELPRLLHRALQPRSSGDQRSMEALMLEQQRTNRLLQTIVCVALGFLLGVVVMQVLVHLAPR